MSIGKNVLKSQSRSISSVSFKQTPKEVAKEKLLFVTLRINVLSGKYEPYSPRRIERFRERVNEIAKEYNVPDKGEEVDAWIRKTKVQDIEQLVERLNTVCDALQASFMREQRRLRL